MENKMEKKREGEWGRENLSSQVILPLGRYWSDDQNQQSSS